jgi:hypothetical protein
MAIAQDITTLKITGRHTSPIYPTDWLAGVDYDDRQAHDRQRDEDYIEDEEAMRSQTKHYMTGLTQKK